MKRPLFIFDVDGVLVDTSAANVDAYQHGFRSIGLPVPEADKVRALLGLPAEVMSSGLGCPENRVREFLAEHVWPRFREILPVLARGFPGVAEILEELRSRGASIAAWTAGDAHLQEVVLSGAGLRRFINFVHAHGTARHPKPDPRGLAEIVSHFNGAVPRYLIDDRADLLSHGREIGAVKVFAAYGFGRLEGGTADVVLRSPGDLLTLLDSTPRKSRSDRG